MTKAALKKEIKAYMNVGLNFDDACNKVNNNHINKYLFKIFEIKQKGSL